MMAKKKINKMMIKVAKKKINKMMVKVAKEKKLRNDKKKKKNEA